MQNVALNNVNIHIVTSEKCLSITSDSKLTWDVHTKKLSKAFSGKVKKLHEMRYFSKQTLETVYFKGILPAVLYGILLWGNCADHLLNSIEKIHLRAARFINRIKKKVLDTEVLTRINWKPISYITSSYITRRD